MESEFLQCKNAEGPTTYLLLKAEEEEEPTRDGHRSKGPEEHGTMKEQNSPASAECPFPRTS